MRPSEVIRHNQKIVSFLPRILSIWFFNYLIKKGRLSFIEHFYLTVYSRAYSVEINGLSRFWLISGDRKGYILQVYSLGFMGYKYKNELKEEMIFLKDVADLL